jgi:hypothetical protein
MATPYRCTLCLQVGKVTNKNSEANMRDHLGAPSIHNMGQYACQFPGCGRYSYRVYVYNENNLPLGRCLTLYLVTVMKTTTMIQLLPIIKLCGSLTRFVLQPWTEQLQPVVFLMLLLPLLSLVLVLAPLLLLALPPMPLQLFPALLSLALLPLSLVMLLLLLVMPPLLPLFSLVPLLPHRLLLLLLLPLRLLLSLLSFLLPVPQPPLLPLLPVLRVRTTLPEPDKLRSSRTRPSSPCFAISSRPSWQIESVVRRPLKSELLF